MATPVKVVASGGLPVSEAVNGTPMSPTADVHIPDATPVTIIASGGSPVTFVGTDGVLWPGGVAP